MGVCGADTGMKLAGAGYEVHGLDYEGHGKSAGLHGFVNNMDFIINDCIHHITRVSRKNLEKKKVPEIAKRFKLTHLLMFFFSLSLEQKERKTKRG